MLGVAAVIEQNVVSNTKVIPKEIARLSSWAVNKYEIKDRKMERTERAQGAYLIASNASPRRFDVSDEFVNLSNGMLRCKLMPQWRNERIQIVTMGKKCACHVVGICFHQPQLLRSGNPFACIRGLSGGRC